MKKTLLSAVIFLLIVSGGNSFSKPDISFTELVTRAELNPGLMFAAEKLAAKKNIPAAVFTRDNVIIEAKGIENGKVVYSVITNPADIYNGSYTLFFDEIQKNFDLSTSYLIFSKNNVQDHTGGHYSYSLSQNSFGLNKFLLITDWTFDRVWAFSPVNGDLIDTAFIYHDNPNLQSPKHALQSVNNFIYVSDQISDLVQKYDTSGFYVSLFAPAGGVNNTIVDNMRGIAFRPNWNLLATVGSGTNQNTIQEFDLNGNHLGSFVPSGTLNSPFDIHYRDNDILISNSSGSNDVIRYDYSGTFLSNFIVSTNLSFAQQIFRNENGNLAVSGFSTPSGLILFDSSGNYIRSLTGVTGNRGVYLLSNGHYLVTNGAGVHEIDSASGNLIRTVVSGTSFQYISEYIPGGLVGVSSHSNGIPDKFYLSQNYPNPFNPKTIINYSLGKAENVTLKVYDILGNETAELVNEKQNAGSYSVEFDGNALSSGVYFYRFIAGEYSGVKRMILLK
ncbi:MAG: T9SS type A sorting domain-containing protein [Bacteroidetes bacterium]|nr:T9SS type A sorting domain-containing protein [Bacteroidota bacterium]